MVQMSSRGFFSYILSKVPSLVCIARYWLVVPTTVGGEYSEKLLSPDFLTYH